MDVGIELLRRSAWYDFRTLRMAFDQFNEMDEGAKEEFAQDRMRLIAASDKVLDPMGMSSSGYQNGKSRRYVWGPCFWAMNEFFNTLKLDGIDVAGMVHLYPLYKPGLNHPDPKFMMRPTSPYDKPHSLYMAGIPVHDIVRSQGSWLRHFLDEIRGDRKGKVVLWSCPSYFETLFSFGLDPELLDPDLFAIYSTGEALRSELDPVSHTGIDVRNAMRCWDGGATMFTCRYGGTHWVDFLSNTRVEDGLLVSTDLFNLDQSFIEHHNGDHVTISRGSPCRCGMSMDTVEFMDRERSVRFNGHVIDYRAMVSELEFLVEGEGHDVKVAMLALHPMSDELFICFNSSMMLGQHKVAKVQAGLESLFKIKYARYGSLRPVIINGINMELFDRSQYKRFPIIEIGRLEHKEISGTFFEEL